MEEKELNEIIVVKQLPEIKEKLQLISDEIDKEIDYALSLEVNEDTVKEVKNVRAKLNKINTALEEKRKYVKNAILSPYESFLEIYDKLVKNKLNEADNTLKMRINDIEDKQKKLKEEELREFADEHIKANNLQDIISFEDIDLNITLTASLKNLKEQVLNFVKKVSDDIECIASDENRDEVLYEYQHNNFNYQQAILNIRKRKEEINILNKQQELKVEQKQQEQQVIEKVDEAIEITAPIEVEEQETYQFTIKATKTQVKQLIEYMKELKIEYE